MSSKYFLTRENVILTPGIIVKRKNVIRVILSFFPMQNEVPLVC